MMTGITITITMVACKVISYSDPVHDNDNLSGMMTVITITITRSSHIQIPYMIMMLICLAGSIATSFLPETLGAKLPETLEASLWNPRASLYILGTPPAHFTWFPQQFVSWNPRGQAAWNTWGKSLKHICSYILSFLFMAVSDICSRNMRLEDFTLKPA